MGRLAGLMHSGAGEPALRFSGIFKIGPTWGETGDNDPLRLRMTD